MIKQRMSQDVRAGTQTRSFVYRLYDLSGVLLYIGKTRIVPGRILDHVDRAWGYRIARCSLEIFETMHDARVAEQIAITTENPVFNVQRGGRYLRRDGRPSIGFIADFPLKKLPQKVVEVVEGVSNGTLTGLEDASQHLGMSYGALRLAKMRSDDFPQPKARRGKTYLYSLDELSSWRSLRIAVAKS